MTEKDIRSEIAEMQSGSLNQRANALSKWLTGDKKKTFDELMYYLSLHRDLIGKMLECRVENEPVPINRPQFFQMSKPARKRK